jgi:predicted transcriptional regulator
MEPDWLGEERRAKIEALAEYTGRTPDEVLTKIVDEYFVELEELRALIDEGLADVAAGRVLTEDQVKERLAAYAKRVRLEDESA